MVHGVRRSSKGVSCAGEPRAGGGDRRGSITRSAVDSYASPAGGKARGLRAGKPKGRSGLAAPRARAGRSPSRVSSPLEGFWQATHGEQRQMVEHLIDPKGAIKSRAPKELFPVLVEEICGQIAALLTLGIAADLRCLIAEFAFGPIGESTPAPCLPRYDVDAMGDTHIHDPAEINHLHYHAKSGDLGELCYLLNHRAGVNARDTCDFTALHYAAGKGLLDIVAWLLTLNADVNLSSGSGFSALDAASRKGKLSVVKLLVACGAHVRRAGGFQALDWAAENGNTEICAFLIEKKANVCGCDDHGRSPAFWALMRGHTHTFRALLECNADPNKRSGENKRSLLLWAIDRRNKKAVELLLRSKADMSLGDWHDQTPLEFAMRENDDDATWAMLQALHETSGDFAALDVALNLAVSKEKHEVIAALLVLMKEPPMEGMPWNGARALYAAEAQLDRERKAIVAMSRQHAQLPRDIVEEIAEFILGKGREAYVDSKEWLFLWRICKGIWDATSQ